MSNCSNHKKEIAGITDMKELATLIGDLHYEALRDFLVRLEVKLLLDSKADAIGKRKTLSDALLCASGKISEAAEYIHKAWQISKKFMDKENQTND